MIPTKASERKSSAANQPHINSWNSACPGLRHAQNIVMMVMTSVHLIQLLQYHLKANCSHVTCINNSIPRLSNELHTKFGYGSLDKPPLQPRLS